MATDREEIKKALDSFEEEDFMTAKEILKQQVQGAIHDYAKEKLDLEKPLSSKEDE